MMMSRHLSSRRLFLWMLLASIMLKCHANAYLFGYYEDIVGNGKDGLTTAIKIGLKNCFNCEHWNSCSWGTCQIPIPKGIVYAERLWDGLLIFASTFEVLVRGFTLGFGLRMFHFIFSEGDPVATKPINVLRSYRRQILISVVAGLSLAAFLHGSSLFVPVDVRQNWFEYEHQNDRSEQSDLPNTDVPMALFQYIRRELIAFYKTADGTLDCTSQSNCDEDTCDDSTCKVIIDFWFYVWIRLGTGLAYLATTLEALLRGFFLGFGARMLKFIFLTDGAPSSSSENKRSDSNPDPQSDNDNSDEYRLLLEWFKQRALVSAISGLSVAAIVHGSSLFVPAQLRDLWFVEGADMNVGQIVPSYSTFSVMLTFCWCTVILFKTALG